MKTFPLYLNYPLSKKYYLVMIFPTRKQMIAHAERVMRNGGKSNWSEPALEACCIPLVLRPRARKVGLLLFSQGNMPSSTIAHELDHCATFWIQFHEPPFRRKTYSNENANEYRASLVDRLTQQFYEALEEVAG